jgi:hypothetical protein
MKRRDFLSTAALSGYSAVVWADRIPPATLEPTPLDDYRRRFGVVAPSGETTSSSTAAANGMSMVALEADVLVAGGGLAGVCAAIAAARHGARVILIQDRSRLGGNSSSEVKMHVVGANCLGHRPGWREGGLIEEFRLDDAVHNPQRSVEMWDLLLYDKVISEPNIVLLLDSVLYAASRQGNRIDHVMVRCDKTEHLYRIKARVYCDCTGDARLGLEAGAAMRAGREGMDEYHESMAPSSPDNHTLGSSILFTSRRYPMAMPFTPPKWARKIASEHIRIRKPGTWEYGYWWIEWGGDRNIIRDNERIRFELLSIVLGIWDYIKNSGDYPSSDHWALDWVGMVPGKRGSRRLIGDHVLTQHDLLAGGLFPDAVAIGGWPMDDHPPGGFDRPDLPPNKTLPTPEVYGIPLRALYSRNVENLMMAGRNISCSHVAFTSTRVMATCSVIGQGVGTAAAMCARERVTPRELTARRERMDELQQELLRDDQAIRNVVNKDPRDMARQAAVTASHEEDDAKAVNIIDGHLRDIYGEKARETHHWAGRLGAEGAWIELNWSSSRQIAEIQLTFDTGFHRLLMLTPNDGHNRKVLRAPQPETIRDYRILYRAAAGAELKELADAKGNYQRVNRHRVGPVHAQAIRIHVTATNGDPLARIFEVRCYA